MNDSITYQIPEQIINNISSLTTLLKAVGGFIIFYIIFQVIMIIINKTKKNELIKINKNLNEIKTLLKENSKK
ncbi:MAG: hypothetical protein ACOC3Z_03010 [Nanoarchaeota archaeon]